MAFIKMVPRITFMRIHLPLILQYLMHDLVMGRGVPLGLWLSLVSLIVSIPTHEVYTLGLSTFLSYQKYGVL